MAQNTSNMSTSSTAKYIALIGIVNDENSSFMHGPALAPVNIRRVLHNGLANLTAESSVYLTNNPYLKDQRNLPIGTGPGELMKIEQHVFKLIAQGFYIFVLGNNHAISYPILRAHKASYKN